MPSCAKERSLSTYLVVAVSILFGAIIGRVKAAGRSVFKYVGTPVIFGIAALVGTSAMPEKAYSMPTLQVVEQNVGFDTSTNTFYGEYGFLISGDDPFDNLESLEILAGQNYNLTPGSFTLFDNTSGNSIFNPTVSDNESLIDVLVNYDNNILLLGITSHLGENQEFNGLTDVGVYGTSMRGENITGPNDFNNGLPIQISIADYKDIPTGDVNKDGQVDMCDLLIIASNWLILDADYSDGDISGDGNVGLEDFVILAGHWMEGVE